MPNGWEKHREKHWQKHRTLRIREGDWFVTKDSKYNKGGTRRPECYEYCLKPKDGWGLPAGQVKVSKEPLPLSTYIGPVHGRPEYYNGYVTVRVPLVTHTHTNTHTHARTQTQTQAQTQHRHRITRDKTTSTNKDREPSRITETPKKKPYIKK